MTRVADYIFDYLAAIGCRHVFVITGGGAMFLNDGLARCSRLKYVCCHHEQACAMAADGYARISGKMGVVSVTTGPGGINALNGVFGAYTDSIPMLVISGQVKRETCLGAYHLPKLRQLGDQEVDIVRMAGGVTKYAALVQDPLMIRYHLERAVHLAAHGRPGPCWLDIPVDVQSAMIEPERLKLYRPEEDKIPFDAWALSKTCQNIIALFQRAKRPVIMPGTGVRLAGAMEIFETVIQKLGAPVATAWTGVDILPTDHPLFCGRASSIGDRAGNFTVQNSDLLLVLGSRLNIRQISYNWKDFARNAYKVQVDADPAELEKPTVKPDLAVSADLKIFLEELNRQIDAAGVKASTHADWLAWCRKRVARYPVVQDRHRASAKINSYHFLDALIRKLNAQDIIACGDGTASVVPYQVAFIKRGMRMFANSGSASMGFDLPSAVGAAFAGGGRRVICLAGDGSSQMNIQELQTIKFHQLPIKIFILNNGGYLSMRLTQGGFFKGNFIGESPRSGLSFPDYVRVAEAYGLPARRLAAADFSTELDEFLNLPGPGLCEVMLDPEQGFEPRLSSRQLPDGTIVTASFEDMAPFLSREELAENMLPGPTEMNACVRRLILDLDGTLIDSRPGIRESFGVAVAAVFPGRAFDLTQIGIGPPLRRMFELAFPEAAETEIPALIAAFRGHYEQTGWRNCALYAGVMETLEECRRRGMKMEVATNKPGRISAAILAHFKIDGYFHRITASDSAQPPFAGKHAMLRGLLNSAQVSQEEYIYVGDSLEDALACRECGLKFVWASYGYGELSGENAQLAARTLKRMDDLLAILDEV